MESLKVALATDWFFPSFGGIEYHVHDLAVQLLRLGHEPHVITRLGKYNDASLPYPVHRFKGDFNSEKLHISMGPSLLKSVNELYKKEKFDITHGHSIFSPLAVGTANLSVGIRGIPSTLTDHSIMNRSFAAPVYRFVLRHSLGKVTSFIAVSRAVKEDLEKILGKKLRGRPIYVVYNGIDAGFWRPPEDKEEWKKKLGLSGDVIVTTSRLTRKKRVQILPHIAKQVIDEHSNTTFVLIGDGPLKETIKKKIKLLGLERRFVLTGRLDRTQVRQYLWASDIYLSPTIEEAFGIAIVEAQATGLPSVARNSGGIKEVVENGRTGILTDSDKGLVEGTLELLKNEELRKKMGEEASRLARSRFNWEKIAPLIVDVYRKTMDIFEENYYALYRIHQRLVRRKLHDIIYDGGRGAGLSSLGK